MKTAVVYARVSTLRQAEEGVSLEAQEARAVAWCKLNNHAIYCIEVDRGKSAAKMNSRPALIRAIELACKMKGTLVVYSLSRMARSTQDAIQIMQELERHGADLVSLTESIDTTTAAGRMLYKMLAVFAEFEREIISERTTAALRFKKLNGEKTGGTVPYGYEVMLNSYENKILVINPAEQKVIDYMVRLRETGSPYSHIVKMLNRNGTPTRNGGPWNRNVVANIIKAQLERERQSEHTHV